MFACCSDTLQVKSIWESLEKACTCGVQAIDCYFYSFVISSCFGQSGRVYRINIQAVANREKR